MNFKNNIDKMVKEFTDEIRELEKMVVWVSGKDFEEVKKDYDENKEEFPEFHS